MSQSEVARLKQQIIDEYTAAKQGLIGIAITSKHEFITTRQERIAQHFERLSDLLGIEQAAQVVVEIIDSI